MREPIYTGYLYTLIRGLSVERRLIVICILTSLFILIYTNTIAIAQSSTILSSSPTSGVDDDQYHGWPLTISGLIYDADRKPVSGAIVTLYREGQIVNRSNAGATANAYGGPALNPVISAYNHLEDSSSEGSYAFSGLYPGVYEVTVEKCSYNTSTLVDVNDSKAIYHGMIHMDIWIDGYHGPV